MPVAALAALLEHDYPYAYCYACLVKKVGRTEKDVRDAAQVLVLRPGFGVRRRICYACGAAGVSRPTSVVRKAPN